MFIDGPTCVSESKILKPPRAISVPPVNSWISVVRPSRRRLRRLLRVRSSSSCHQGAWLILRRPRSGRLEGRTAPTRRQYPLLLDCFAKLLGAAIFRQGVGGKIALFELALLLQPLF